MFYYIYDIKQTRGDDGNDIPSWIWTHVIQSKHYVSSQPNKHQLHPKKCSTCRYYIFLTLHTDKIPKSFSISSVQCKKMPSMCVWLPKAALWTNAGGTDANIVASRSALQWEWSKKVRSRRCCKLVWTVFLNHIIFKHLEKLYVLYLHTFPVSPHALQWWGQTVWKVEGVACRPNLKLFQTRPHLSAPSWAPSSGHMWSRTLRPLALTTPK